MALSPRGFSDRIKLYSAMLLHNVSIYICIPIHICTFIYKHISTLVAEGIFRQNQTLQHGVAPQHILLYVFTCIHIRIYVHSHTNQISTFIAEGIFRQNQTLQRDVAPQRVRPRHSSVFGDDIVSDVTQRERAVALRVVGFRFRD